MSALPYRREAQTSSFSAAATYPSRSAGFGANNTACASGLDRPYSLSPVEDIIDVKVSTRSGQERAIVWAIIPPIEAPTTWARSIPSALSSPRPSSAMWRRR